MGDPHPIGVRVGVAVDGGVLARLEVGLIAMYLGAVFLAACGALCLYGAGSADSPVTAGTR